MQGCSPARIGAGAAKRYPFPYIFSHNRRIVRGMQINIYLLDRAPKTLYPYIIAAKSTSIHRNTDMIIRQHLLPFRRCILTSLVGVHYINSTMLLYDFARLLL